MVLSLFIIVNLISSLVFTVSNPVYAAFFLILTFLASAVILWILNSSFFALIYIIIYVGAIAVLFLFVIMMLEIKIVNHRQVSNFNFLNNIFLYLILIFVPFFISFLISSSVLTENSLSFEEDFVLIFDSNLELPALGQVLYNNYTICVIIGGLILLVAVLGSIVLTLNITIKQTKITSRQLARSENFLSFFK